MSFVCFVSVLFWVFVMGSLVGVLVNLTNCRDFCC